VVGIGLCVAQENLLSPNDSSVIVCPLSAKGAQMGIMRTEPYIWTTWLTKLLVGEEFCEWGAWFKTHHQSYNKVPDSFDRTAWQMEHTALLTDILGGLESQQYAIFLERQNYFTARGKQSGITIGGQPDLIATKGSYGLICDAKTGQPRPSDHIQVMIYMWAIPYALRQYSAMSFDGKVIYRDHEIEILNSAINEPFINNLAKLIQRLGSADPSRKVPSAIECRFCQIANSECPERIEYGGEQEKPAIDL